MTERGQRPMAPEVTDPPFQQREQL
jgi:hypothetical protein